MKKGLLSGTSEALASLKVDVKPNAGELLKSTKDTVNNTATAVLGSISRFTEDFIRNPESRKDALGMASTAVVAYLLMPYINKEKARQKQSKEPDKRDEPEQSQFTQADKLAPIPSKATSSEIVSAMLTNAKTLDEMYARYLKSKDPQEIKYFLTRAIMAKESGYNTDPLVAARFINVEAIAPDNASGRYLKEKGISWKIPGKSGYLLPNEKYLSSFDAFKERICSELQPDVPEPARTNNAAEILIRCAVGKGQILPIHFISGIKDAGGQDKLKMVYDFIKSGDKQAETTARLVENYGQKYDWNPACIAAAYYGGPRAGDMIKNNPQSASLDKEQPYGYGSIRAYVERVSNMTQRLIKDQKAA